MKAFEGYVERDILSSRCAAALAGKPLSPDSDTNRAFHRAE
jgi:hypothetical protein